MTAVSVILKTAYRLFCQLPIQTGGRRSTDAPKANIGTPMGVGTIGIAMCFQPQFAVFLRFPHKSDLGQLRVG